MIEGKQLKSIFILFSVSCFVIELICDISLSFLKDIDILFNFSASHTYSLHVNYFLIMGVAFVIYGALTLVGINIFGSGLRDESIATMRRVASSALVYFLLVPFANITLSRAGLVGFAISWCLIIIYWIGVFATHEE